VGTPFFWPEKHLGIISIISEGRGEIIDNIIGRELRDNPHIMHYILKSL